MLAEACHQFSARNQSKFIAVNCAGLPESEAETEMFGRSDAGHKNVGFFELANGGTVLLDSISELSLEMQGKLLRFLNDGVFRRVGEADEIKVDVRVICTSQQPLSALVAEGKVREDLYHRLNVLTLNLPPLRERIEDLPILTDVFIAEISQLLGMEKPSYDEKFLKALQQHHWSGNLRELHNAIYRACSLATSHQLKVEDLNLANAQEKGMSELDIEELEKAETLEELMHDFESVLLRKFYVKYPSTRKLAQRLGLSHTAVANKLRFYGINKND